MNPIPRILGLAFSLAILCSSARADVTVSNVRSAQRAGTKLVFIDYDLAGSTPPFTVSVRISGDDGVSFTVPATSLAGAFGAGQTAGTNKRISWNAGVDWNGKYTPNMRFEVSATDTAVAVIPDGFVLIPAGSFQMGDQSNPLVGNSNELPVHTVYVSEFYMAKYETTKELWDSVRAWGMSNGHGYDLAAGASKGANHPLHSISWHDMIKWCNARSEMENLVPCYNVGGVLYKTGQNNNVVCDWSANGYRLPTEAEWEKAARGGVPEKNFPWGTDKINHSNANYKGNSAAFSYDTSGYTTYTYHPDYTAGGYPCTAPVDSFAPNDYGLYNMAGNVWEWCWDWHSSYGSDSQPNPHGPILGLNRVDRGGGWSWSNANYCRSSYRDGEGPDPESFNNELGFRLARILVPEK